MNLTIERQVHMAAQLYQHRDLARRMLGSKYRATMRDLAGGLSRIAEQRKSSVLSAAIQAAKGVDGFDQVLILAAAVEHTEPSAPEVSHG